MGPHFPLCIHRIFAADELQQFLMGHLVVEHHELRFYLEDQLFSKIHQDVDRNVVDGIMGAVGKASVKVYVCCDIFPVLI